MEGVGNRKRHLKKRKKKVKPGRGKHILNICRVRSERSQHVLPFLGGYFHCVGLEHRLDGVGLYASSPDPGDAGSLSSSSCISSSSLAFLHSSFLPFCFAENLFHRMELKQTTVQSGKAKVPFHAGKLLSPTAPLM